MAQLRRHKDQFDRLNARVVLVGLGSVEQTAAFRMQFDLPFTMIADPQKRLFGVFRLKQASNRSLMSVGIAVKGLSTMVKGFGLGIPKGDVRQLPGVFIIDPDGKIRFSHHAKDPADHPQPDTLLAVLQMDAQA